LFAAIWLLVSTLAVARAFLYLAEARIDKRHRRITNWVLHRDITVEDLLAAGMNNNGFIRCGSILISRLFLSV
jgi:potassium channel subfamily K